MNNPYNEHHPKKEPEKEQKPTEAQNPDTDREPDATHIPIREHKPNESEQTRAEQTQADEPDLSRPEPVIATDRYADTESSAHAEAPEPLKHSGVGIASVVIAVLAWSMTIISIFIAFPPLIEFTESIDPMSPAVNDQLIIEWLDANPSVLALFAAIIVAGGLSFVGLVLGLISLFSPRRKKVFPVIGSILNGLPFAALFFLFMLGLTM